MFRNLRRMPLKRGHHLPMLVCQRLKHQIPKHLEKVASDKDPEFSAMVLYYYHKAAQTMEPEAIKQMEKYPHMKPEERQARVKAILNLIGSVATSVEVNFPIVRKNGNYEIVTGYRAHHVRHRLPLKGGKYPSCSVGNRYLGGPRFLGSV